MDRSPPAASPLNSHAPARLRNRLAGLLLEAIGEPDAGARSRTAAAAIVLLKAFGDLTAGSGGPVSLRALLARARRVAPQWQDALEAGAGRVCPEYLERAAPRPDGSDESVGLRGTLAPYAPFVRTRAAAYARLLRRAAALPAFPGPPDEHGIAVAALLFNAGLYFEAHEVLERVWRVAAGNVRTFAQGLLQVAVALHHATAGNLAGARTLLRKGTEKLRRAPAAVPSADVSALLAELVPWERDLAQAVAGDARQLAGSGSTDLRVPAHPRLRLPPYAT
jgi:hypothetical protein